eukprot:TRINITY_DN5559_c0_g1_i1.p1 TRINITY_DN5559_c0_g1~~TRINITY_DN5559_c0_g1_i1.p1  ORF type:complete len:149 (+),score=18.38 TRINITY_DN5559_c0_g1_i1:43-447(+)
MANLRAVVGAPRMLEPLDVDLEQGGELAQVLLFERRTFEDAKRRFEETTAFQKEQCDEVVALEKRLSAMERQTMESRITAMESGQTALGRRNAALEQENQDLGTTVQRLQEENSRLGSFYHAVVGAVAAYQPNH